MVRTDWIDTVERLIEICKDGEQGYREAARKVVHADLRDYFEKQSSTRAQFADELRREMPGLIEVHVHESIAAVVHRGWIDLLATLGGGEKRVLTAVREGEEIAISAYKTALASPLPPQFEWLARRQLENIERVYNDLASWEPGLAA